MGKTRKALRRQTTYSVSWKNKKNVFQMLWLTCSSSICPTKATSKGSIEIKEGTTNSCSYHSPKRFRSAKKFKMSKWRNRKCRSFFTKDNACKWVWCPIALWLDFQPIFTPLCLICQTCYALFRSRVEEILLKIWAIFMAICLMNG
jgi:hypothetical protein